MSLSHSVEISLLRGVVRPLRAVHVRVLGLRRKLTHLEMIFMIRAVTTARRTLLFRLGIDALGASTNQTVIGTSRGTFGTVYHISTQ